MRIFDNITETIGNTPLVRLQRLGHDLPGKLVLKLEFFNPLGSVKDRIGFSMIEKAEKEGKIHRHTKIVEPTSGNTGIGLAFICATKGYDLTLVMPETMSIERRALLLLLGAKLVLTPGPLGMRGAVAKVREMQAKNDAIFVPGQFENPSNPDIHRKTTALEIWNDTDGQVDIVVCGVGTGGTLTGVGEVLKAKKPSVKIVAVEPQESAVISGEPPGQHKIAGIGAGFIPDNLNMAVVDSVIKVSSEEALSLARKLIKEEGIPFGISSGAAMAAALRVAELPENEGKLIVVIIPSYTERYLSTGLAEEEMEIAKNLPIADIDERFLS